jgi:hypothetical protein
MSVHHQNGLARGEAYEALIAAANSCGADNGIYMFCGNPFEYIWQCVGKREIVVPYNCAPLRIPICGETKLHAPGAVRGESHTVWIVEGTLRPGESNVLARRRFYIAEESWLIVSGEGYDMNGTLTQSYMLDHSSMPGASIFGRWYALT